jgi:hypothetical protein
MENVICLHKLGVAFDLRSQLCVDSRMTRQRLTEKRLQGRGQTLVEILYLEQL